MPLREDREPRDPGMKKNPTPPPAPGSKVPHPRPRQAGETDEAYNRRVANHAMSQERLKSVGITGGVNNAKAGQIKAFEEKYGRKPSGYNPGKPGFSAENPSKEKNPPSPNRNPKKPVPFDDNPKPKPIEPRRFPNEDDVKKNPSLNAAGTGGSIRKAFDAIKPPSGGAVKMLGSGGSKARQARRMARRAKRGTM